MSNEFSFDNIKPPPRIKHEASSIPPSNYIRLNKCHDFKETQELWQNAANRTAKIGGILVIIYTILGYFLLAYLEGLRGIDCWYFLATTLTTIGLGDFYPSKELTRGIAIFMLPFGLIIISFGISLAAAQAQAAADILPSDLKEAARLLEEALDNSDSEKEEDDENDVEKDDEEEEKQSKEKRKVSVLKNKESSREELGVVGRGRAMTAVVMEKTKTGYEKFKVTRYWNVFVMMSQYFAILFVGAIIMYTNHHERKKQNNALDEEFTFVDAMFFATVVATTVGYGHEIVPLTDTSKGLMVPYMFFSTFVVGGIISGLSGLYLSYKEDYINDQMIESTTWVHRSDLDKDGRVSEADFVLFKLQQMQKVDRDMMDRLIAKYHELDVDGEGALDIGIDVPSAEHVKQMQSVVIGTGMTLPQLWRQIQPEISAKAKAEAKLKQVESGPGKSTRGSIVPPGDINYVKLSECHDFKWSKELWKKAADETAVLSCIMLFFYIGLGSYLMAYQNGLSGIDAWYFLLATLTTVGYGDFAPEDQFTRGCSIIMIPFGLGVLGFGLSYLIAYSNSKPYKQRRAGGVGPSKTVGGANTNTQRQGAMLNQSKLATRKDTYDKNNERFDRRSPNVSNDDIRLSEIEMTDWLLFDSNDTFLIKLKKIIEKINSIRTETILGKCISLLFKISLVVFVGAMFFKFHKPEVERLELTWIDALYFGTVTATSIGYGDITAQSDGGKIFLCFYMLISTILMADSLGDFIDLYVSDIVGEAIIDEIIDSTIWVHKCDLDMDGKVSEADYVLFKLQQMQKVDASMMDVLIDRYHDLDVDGEGALDVGIDIPSAEQVKTMQELKDNTETPRTLTELWKDMQLALRRKRTESRSSSMGQENPMRSSVEFDEDTMQPHVGSGFEDNKDDMRDAQISAPSNIEMIELQIEEKTIVN